MKHSSKSVGTNGTGGSSHQGTSTGSGARPGGGKFPIATSAPAHKHHLGRKTPGSLK